jgi:Ca-activated chloride channel homolog
MPVFVSLLCLLLSLGHTFLDTKARQQSKTDRPIAMSLLLDNSLRLEPSRTAIRAQLADFIRTLRPNDAAELIEFSNDVKILQRFTSDTGALTNALTKSASPSGRAVYGAVHMALKELDKFKSQGNCGDCRLMLIVIAGGPDISSVIRANQLLALVSRARDVRIYGVAVPVKGHPLDREIESMFRQMAQMTGGRAFFPNRIEELPDVYSQLRDELFGASALPGQQPGGR